MNRPGLFLSVCLIALLPLSPSILNAQTNCESGSGALNSERPNRTTPDEIIKQFTAKDSLFMAARKNYTFTQDVTIQTLRTITPRGEPIADGEFRQVSEVSFDSNGNRLERVTFAPQSTLRRIQIGPHDLEDIRQIMPFMLPTEDLPQYTLKYLGQQHVDEIDTYVFEVAPKTFEPGKRYFSGKLWVDNHDLAIVKTCGKGVPDVAPVKTNGRPTQDVQPQFVTYREQIDGNWLPTYTRSDDFLFFSPGFVRIREIIKFKYRKSSGTASPNTPAKGGDTH